MEFASLSVQYLRACGVKSFPPFIKKMIQSHAYYPALISLTDTLEYLQIDYVALEVDKEKVAELPLPVLAKLNNNGSEKFQIIKSAKELKENAAPGAGEQENIILFIEPNSEIKNEQHLLLYKSYSASKNLVLFAAGLITILSLASFALHFTFSSILFASLSLAGAFICGLIILHTLGQDIAFTRKLCNTDSNEGCDKILHSKASNFLKHVSLGDIGLIYFISTFFLIVFSNINNQVYTALQLTGITAPIGILITLASIWYQWRVAKTWCRMCLLVISVLWLQAIVLYAQTFELITSPRNIYNLMNAQFAFTLGFSILIPAVALYVIKQLSKKLDETEQNNIQLLRIKHNPKIFTSLLKQQKKVNSEFWNREILLGSADASLQIISVCNPYCYPCALMHKKLEPLLEQYGQQIGIRIRFLVHDVSETSKTNMAVNQIFNTYFSAKDEKRQEEAIHTWFELMDLPAYQEKLGGTASSRFQAELLKQHNTWSEESEIQYTPTIFINGYQLPDEYTIDDVGKMINTLVD